MCLFEVVYMYITVVTISVIEQLEQIIAPTCEVSVTITREETILIGFLQLHNVCYAGRSVLLLLGSSFNIYIMHTNMWTKLNDSYILQNYTF